MISGMSRPFDGAHHSSTIQSLYAFTQRSASSLSLRSENVWPQKRGKLGKQSDASTWLTSMSSRRAFGSQQPTRMSSIVIGLTVISSRGYPAAADEARERRREVLDEPPVAVRAVFVGARLLVGEDAADERHRLDLAPLDAAGRPPCTSPGSRSCHTFGGSMTWSSTEMIFGISGAMHRQATGQSLVGNE